MKRLLSNLLVVVNGSESSIAAVKYGIAMRKTMGSALTAVYIVDTATIKQLSMSRIFIAEESEEYERSLEQTGQRYLDYAAQLGKSKRIHIDTRLVKGSVADEVLKLEEELGIDCVLLGGWERESSVRDVIREANLAITKASSASVLYVKKKDAEIIYNALTDIPMSPFKF